jgi:hypothetical protein
MGYCIRDNLVGISGHCLIESNFNRATGVSPAGLEASRLSSKISIIERQIHWKGLNNNKGKRKNSSCLA